MTMSTLMCPHCGGRLLIDPMQRLQSMLSCPYCGRKSLMQKKNGMIVLRGIISQTMTTKPFFEEVQGVTQDVDDQPTVEVQAVADETHQPVPGFEETGTGIVDDLPDGTAAEAINEMDFGDFSPAVKTTVAAGFLANAAAYKDEAVAAVVYPLPPIEPVLTKTFEPVASPVSETATETETAEAETAGEPVVEPAVEPDTAAEPVVEPAVEPDSEVETDTEVEPETVVEPVAEAAPEAAPIAEKIAARKSSFGPGSETETPIAPTNATQTASPKANKEQLVLLATRAAAVGQIPAFNSYSRQAIDCDPTDPRMYELRSKLIEEAHGFARATFLSPIWVGQTPRQKAWIIAQHFASLNAAVTYSPDEKRSAIATEAGALIAWQIRETFVESARLRLGKRPFKGKFRRSDLRPARQIIDACRCINETVVPHVSSDLLRSTRAELARIDPKLADRLERIGF